MQKNQPQSKGKSQLISRDQKKPTVTIAPRLEVSKLHQKICKTNKRILVLRGGTSSTKTYSVLQEIARWLISGIFRGEEIPDGVASVVRQFSATLSRSVLRDFYQIIRNTKIYKGDKATGYVLADYFRENKTERNFTFQNRIVEFFGADDPQKSRGPRRRILYCNEGNELTAESFRQLNLRTKDCAIVDFNPDDEDIWINTDLEQRRAVEKGDVDVIVSTYLDNPFLTPEEEAEIEYLHNVDPMLWTIFGEGKYGKIQGLIFPNVTIVDEIPRAAKLLAYGLDWGFSIDPTSVDAIYLFDKGLYIDELVYESGLTNPKIAERLIDLGIPLTAEIIADSSEPKSIQELSALGFQNIVPAEKGPDSVNFGISVMKQQPIFVTARSLGIRKEFKKYKWLTDKSGNSLGKPIDKFQHGIDSCRYVAISKIGLYRNMGTYSRPEQTNKPIASGLRQKNF